MLRTVAATFLIAYACCLGDARAQAVPGVTGGTAAGTASMPAGFQTIHNDFNWTDTDGRRILTRSGCLAQFNGTFYWYGGNPRGFRGSGKGVGSGSVSTPAK